MRRAPRPRSRSRVPDRPRALRALAPISGGDSGSLASVATSARDRSSTCGRTAVDAAAVGRGFAAAAATGTGGGGISVIVACNGALSGSIRAPPATATARRAARATAPGRRREPAAARASCRSRSMRGSPARCAVAQEATVGRRRRESMGGEACPSRGRALRARPDGTRSCLTWTRLPSMTSRPVAVRADRRRQQPMLDRRARAPRATPRRRRRARRTAPCAMIGPRSTSRRHEMHGAAVDAHAVGQRAPVRVQARIERQQRRMNVDDAARVAARRTRRRARA